MPENKEFVGSVKAKSDYAVFNNADIPKEQIKEWLVKDIKGVFILLSDLIQTPEAIDALTEVFYKRYCDLHKSSVQQELNLQENG